MNFLPSRSDGPPVGTVVLRAAGLGHLDLPDPPAVGGLSDCCGLRKSKP